MMLHKIKNFSKTILFVALMAATMGVTSVMASAATPSAGSLGCNGTNLKPGQTTTDPNCVPPPTAPVITTSTNSTLIDTYLNPLIKLLTVLVGVAVTFGVIYGGIEYSMSAGDPQKASNGRKHIRNAVIALVAYALTLGFLNFIIPGGILA